MRLVSYPSDIPQLARFLFLRQAWRLLLPEDDSSWIEGAVNDIEPGEFGPGSALGPALKRLLDLGARTEDIHEVARIVQWELLSSICYLLGDPSVEESELRGIGWALVECDAAGNVGREIAGLVESVLETDPSGREMRPKDSSGTD